MKEKALLMILALGVACLAALPALADEDRVSREYRFDVSDIEEIEIRASVGSVDIVPTDGDEIELFLQIEGQKNGWFFKNGRKDVSEVELESDVRGGRLVLEQTEDDTQTEWTIRMPQVARTRITLGVGEVKAELMATELVLEVGVGNIDVDFPEDEAGDIDADAGVGDVGIHGAHEVEESSAFVSQSVRARGNGNHDIRIEVGVGDVDLRLN